MEEIKKLQEIQNEIKKELGGSSLNHLIKYFKIVEHMCINFGFSEGSIFLSIFDFQKGVIFEEYYKLVNKENQALNVFGQTEEFQRKLYKMIIMLKNTN
ncbi:MAG: hypothetical protein ACO25K_06455 [Candidatus Fonsibacter ubiquis]